MKLIFIETEKDGHHISLYTRNLFKKLLKRNQIYFITNKVINSEQFKTLGPYIKKLKIFKIKSQKKPKNYNFINILAFHIKNLVRILMLLRK